MEVGIPTRPLLIIVLWFGLKVHFTIGFYFRGEGGLPPHKKNYEINKVGLGDIRPALGGLANYL